nr:hypothetical protein [Enterococcus innesii]
MGKRYVITEEDSGCGCWGIIGVIFLIGIAVTFWPLFLAAAIIGIIVWYFKFYPDQKIRRQHAKEEKELERLEKEMSLKRRKLNVSNQDTILESERVKVEWKCDYCQGINPPEINKCDYCAAKKD